MPRTMTPGHILRAAAAAEVIPGSAEVDRTGRATWTDGPFALVTDLLRRPDGRLGWRAFVGDATLGPALAAYGGLFVTIEPARDDAVAWPEGTRLPDVVAAFLRDGIGAARGFVADRADLAALLASDGDVRRGDLAARLPAANYPARLVQALIIARDAGADQLCADIQATLASTAPVWAGERQIDVAASARHWAQQYGKALGYAVEF